MVIAFSLTACFAAKFGFIKVQLLCLCLKQLPKLDDFVFLVNVRVLNRSFVEVMCESE